MRKLSLLMTLSFSVTILIAQDSTMYWRNQDSTQKGKYFITIQSGQVMVVKEGSSAAPANDTLLKNGVKVKKDRAVLLNNGKKHRLLEGERIYPDDKIGSWTDSSMKKDSTG